MVGDAHHSVVLLRIRLRLGALPIAQVRETMRPLPIEPLNAAPDFVAGAALIRGIPVPVVDMGVLVGATEPAAFTRFVTLDAGEGLVALAVEGVPGVRSLAPSVFRRLPPMLRGTGADSIAALGALDAELMSVLKLARTVTDRALGLLERGGAAS